MIIVDNIKSLIARIERFQQSPGSLKAASQVGKRFLLSDKVYLLVPSVSDASFSRQSDRKCEGHFDCFFFYQCIPVNSCVTTRMYVDLSYA